MLLGVAVVAIQLTYSRDIRPSDLRKWFDNGGKLRSPNICGRFARVSMHDTII